MTDNIKDLNIINYSKYTMPEYDFIYKIVKIIGEDIISIRELKNYLKDVDQTYLVRSILWLSKFHILQILID